MKKKDLYILLLEDDELDIDIIKSQLQLLDEYNCIVDWVTDKRSYLNALKSNSPDIILCDYKLPQYNGLDALKDLRARNMFIPFIFVTGTMAEEFAAETIKAGAWDYVVKDRLFRLPLAIRGALQLRDERTNAAAVEARNRQLSMAVEQSPRHIIIANTQYKIEYVNHKFSKSTGIEPEEILGKDISMIVPENYRIEFNDLLQNDKNKITKWRGEISSEREDGSILWEDISISPLKDEKGNITHYIVSKEDITQRKIMQQSLIEALDKANQSDRLKEAFLHNLSHEIRTPLNAIIGFSEILSDSKNESLSTLDEYASIIRRSSDQLLSIVSDVLTMASIQTGQETTMLKPVYLTMLINYLSEIHMPSACHKNINLSFCKNFTDDRFFILTDETKLQQILNNLLDNAIKFTHYGSVEMTCMAHVNMVEFIIKDTGIGISKESQNIIFDRFRQADPSISINYGGTGLGLSISRSYAQMLGGSIKVESEPNLGSTFTLTIPDLSREIKDTEEKPKENDPKELPQTILVVEDEINNFLLLKAILEGEHIHVYHAVNGLEAIQLCVDKPNINLILMDIKMPIMDGITAFKEIRKIRKDLPIIALTAYALLQEKKQFLMEGFNDYIVKPITKEVLFEKISKAILIG